MSASPSSPPSSSLLEPPTAFSLLRARLSQLRMNALFGSSSATKVLSVYLDDPTKIYKPGERLSGVVTLLLDNDGKGKQTTKAVELTSSLRVEMTTTFAHPTKDKRNPDKGAEVTRLHTLDRTLWRAEGHSFSSSSTGGTELVKISFSFALPSPALRLPSSFEGGSRKGSSVEGHSVARVLYFIKFVLRKSSRLTPDERLSVPFIVMPPPSLDPRLVPPPILPRSILPLPALPPREPSEAEGWFTTTASKDFKEGFLQQPKKAVVKLSLPLLSSWPRATPIPFHLSLLLLAPLLFHIDPSSPLSPPVLSPPPLSSLSLELVRNVFVQAHGKSQVLHQTVGPVVDLEKEARVWWGTQELIRSEELGGGKGRWGVRVVVVGEMMVGWGATKGAGPSFGVEDGRGLLSCSYHLRLTLPLVPGSKKNTLEVDPLVAVAISSTFLPPPRPIQSSSHSSSSSLSSALPGIGVLSSNDLPPSYLQVEDGWVSELVPEPKGGLDAKEP